mmetsp:Transcript_17955/g.40570  ORF Transcript_17955/g.40570 Transcript_17955/m.40570 type:complete len:202 (+) Transcript_17955:225-830(+)
MLHDIAKYIRWNDECLVVLSVRLSLGIKDTLPVVRLEVVFVVDIDLNLNSLSLGLHRVGGDTNGVKQTANKLSETSRAPADDLSGLQAELGSKNRVRNGAVVTDFAEGKRLVDGRALVTEGIDGSPGVDGDADGKATGDTRGGRSSCRKVVSRDARNILKTRRALLLAGGVQGRGGSGNLGRSKGGSRANKGGGENGGLHL